MTPADVLVVIIHGTGNNPQGNWFPTLAKSLGASGVSAVIPAFPTPEGQNLGNWCGAFDKQVGPLSERMILVGHSIGAGFILRLLESSSVAVRGSFLVSAWMGLLGLAEFDPLIESFVGAPINFSAVRKNMGHCRMYHGENDPYVPLKMSQQLASALAVPLAVIPGGGHLNTASGFNSFPRLHSDILSFLTGS